MGKNTCERVTSMGLQLANGDDKIEIYQEGTWTPSFDGASTGTFSATKAGVYTRINDLMIVKGYNLGITEVIPPSGEAIIKTLPFDAQNWDMNTGWAMATGLAYTSTFNPIWMVPMIDDDEWIYFKMVREDSLADYLQADDITSGSASIWFTMMLTLQ